MTSKQHIRKAMIARRAEMPLELRAESSQHIVDRLNAMLLPPHTIIAGYKAMRGEVDISPALIAAHDKTHTVCLPRVSPPERIMHFLAWHPKMAMKKGAMGNWEPDNDKEVVQPSILWVPLVAFDRAGYRLGYGGGYYDATLQYLKKLDPAICSVGVAFAFQEVERLPREPHDMKLNMIITEKEVVDIA